MTREELLAVLQAEAQRIAQFSPDATWYLFGSALKAPEYATDIDLLIMCEADASIVRVRDALRNTCLLLPLHLFLLTKSEETELGFIVGEGCVRIFPG